MTVSRCTAKYLQIIKNLICCTITLCLATPNDFPDARWPILESTAYDQIELAVKENLFDRTHFVIASSCQLTPFEKPCDFLDEQVTARWTQSLLIQIEPLTNRHGLTVDAGIGYSLERTTLSCYYGEISSHHIEPALLMPMTISYSRPNRSGLLQSYVQLEWELNPYFFSRTTTLFHRILLENSATCSSAFTLFGREKTSAYTPLDTDFEYKYYQVGFSLEHSAY